MTTTNAVGLTDLIRVDSDVGGGNFKTRSITGSTLFKSSAASIKTDATNGTATKLTIVQATINPTNIYLGSGTLSATAGSQTFTGSANCFVGFVPGYNFVITNDQYTVINVVSSNQVTVAEAASRTYVNTPTWTVYPNGTTHNDINQHHFGWIGNDASVGVIGGFNGQNSGRYFAVQGDHEMNWFLSDNGGGNYYFMLNGLGAPNNSRGGSFKVSELASYDSVRVEANGLVSLGYGLSNVSGATLNNFSPLYNHSYTVNGDGTSVISTNIQSPAPTISGSQFSHIFTGGTGAFNGLEVGGTLFVSGSSFTILTWSSTQVTVVEELGANYSSVAYTYVRPQFHGFNSGSASSVAISQSGIIILDNTGSATSQLVWGKDANSLKAVYNSADGGRLDIGGYAGSTPGSFNINKSAAYDSLQILADNSVSIKGNITNTHGSTISFAIPISANHYIGSGTAPTAVTGAGAGTATQTVTLSNAHDTGMIVTVHTGTAPTANATLATITFNTAYATAPNLGFTPCNSAAALLSGTTEVYVTSTTTTVVLTTGTAALTAGTDYKWFLTVVQ